MFVDVKESLFYPHGTPALVRYVPRRLWKQFLAIGVSNKYESPPCICITEINFSEYVSWSLYMYELTQCFVISLWCMFAVSYDFTRVRYR